MRYKPKRRSLLFVPAIKPRFYERALAGEADTITFDLEDSVAPESKSEARDLLANAFPHMDGSAKELSIRINAPSSPFYQDDLALLKTLKPRTVVLSKVESPAEIQAITPVLSLWDMPDSSANLIVLIETIAGYYRAREILGSSPRITAVMLGMEDLAGEMGIPRGTLSENPLLNHMQIEIAIAAHFHGLQCLGPVSRGYGQEANLRDLEAECLYLRKMNVRGKFAIHPSQLPIINRVFDITPEQIEQARRVVAMFESRADGTTVITQDQQMEDLPSLTSARHLITYAEEHGFG